ERWIHRSQQDWLDSITRLQLGEQFITNLLRATPHQLGVIQAYEKHLRQLTRLCRAILDFTYSLFDVQSAGVRDDCISAWVGAGPLSPFSIALIHVLE